MGRAGSRDRSAVWCQLSGVSAIQPTRRHTHAQVMLRQAASYCHIYVNIANRCVDGSRRYLNCALKHKFGALDYLLPVVNLFRPSSFHARYVSL